MSDFKDKVALITGASRGIGAAVAKKLAAAGAHVVLAARTTGGLEEVDDAIRAAGGQATLMPLDLLDLAPLDNMGPALAQKFGRLDIFVGNAAMLGSLTPVSDSDAKEWQRVMDLNLTANYRLLRTLDPLLRAAPAGRVLFVTSDLAQLCTAYWSAYATSKAALEALARVYAAETVKTNVRVNMINPGAVDTALLSKAFPGGFPGATKTPDQVAEAMLALLAPSCQRHGERVSL